MRQPFDRKALAARNALDESEDVESSAAMTPEERLEETVSLSDLILDLAEANGTVELIEPVPLAEKARLFALPLQLMTKRWKPSSAAR